MPITLQLFFCTPIFELLLFFSLRISLSFFVCRSLEIHLCRKLVALQKFSNVNQITKNPTMRQYVLKSSTHTVAIAQHSTQLICKCSINSCKWFSSFRIGVCVCVQKERKKRRQPNSSLVVTRKMYDCIENSGLLMRLELFQCVYICVVILMRCTNETYL